MIGIICHDLQSPDIRVISCYPLLSIKAKTTPIYPSLLI